MTTNDETEETREELWERAFRAGKGVDRLLKDSEYMSSRESLINMFCIWKWMRMYPELVQENNTRRLSEVADMMKHIDAYTEQAVLAARIQELQALNNDRTGETTRWYIQDRISDLQKEAQKGSETYNAEQAAKHWSKG